MITLAEHSVILEVIACSINPGAFQQGDVSGIRRIQREQAYALAKRVAYAIEPYVASKEEIDKVTAANVLLKSENTRLSGAVCSGILGSLLEPDETAALVDFIKMLRDQPK